MISGLLITQLSYRTDEHTVSILKREVEDFFCYLNKYKMQPDVDIHYNVHYNFYFLSLSSLSLQTSGTFTCVCISVGYN